MYCYTNAQIHSLYYMYKSAIYLCDIYIFQYVHIILPMMGFTPGLWIQLCNNESINFAGQYIHEAIKQRFLETCINYS